MIDQLFWLIIVVVIVIGGVMILKWGIARLGLGEFERPIQILIAVLIALAVIYLIWQIVKMAVAGAP